MRGLDRRDCGPLDAAGGDREVGQGSPQAKTSRSVLKDDGSRSRRWLWLADGARRVHSVALPSRGVEMTEGGSYFNVDTCTERGRGKHQVHTEATLPWATHRGKLAMAAESRKKCLTSIW